MTLRDKIQIIPRRLLVDDRGWFLKVITGKENGLPPYTGEVYLTMGNLDSKRRTLPSISERMVYNNKRRKQIIIRRCSNERKI